jgi:ABC-2 type transport system ATP-binding protein
MEKKLTKKIAAANYDALNVVNLNKVASDNKQVLLRNVTFDVPKGSLTVLIGENGAGKSTIIKSIIGLYTYNSGKITIDGIDAKNIKSHYKLSYIPEKENFPNIPAKLFLHEMTRLYGISDKVFVEKTKYFSDLFAIDKKLDLKLPKMSSGQRKKIMIMQGFYNDAQLYIMDEPTENLDPQNRQKFYDELAKLKEQGRSILISTHNLDEISKHADRAVVVDKGRIVYKGKIGFNMGLSHMYAEFKRTGDPAIFSKKITPRSR